LGRPAGVLNFTLRLFSPRVEAIPCAQPAQRRSGRVASQGAASGRDGGVGEGYPLAATLKPNKTSSVERRPDIG
jgi:hypothetical protein